MAEDAEGDLEHDQASSTKPAHFDPPGILAKKEMISSTSASSGISIMPIMPCSMNPIAPVKSGRVVAFEVRLGERVAVGDPDARPATAKTMTAAWTATRPAMVWARIL